MVPIQSAFVIWGCLTYLSCFLVLSSITESDSVNSLTKVDITIALELIEHPLAKKKTQAMSAHIVQHIFLGFAVQTSVI